jgi:hypothetical protein
MRENGPRKEGRDEFYFAEYAFRRSSRGSDPFEMFLRIVSQYTPEQS